jgi:3-methyladenine DNA glycosylase/8-oxoguanine DNA glycosylase
VGEHVNLPSQEEMVQVAEAWRPYRTTATWLLWHCTETDSAVYTYWPEGVL